MHLSIANIEDGHYVLQEGVAEDVRACAARRYGRHAQSGKRILEVAIDHITRVDLQSHAADDDGEGRGHGVARGEVGAELEGVAGGRVEGGVDVVGEFFGAR